MNHSAACYSGIVEEACPQILTGEFRPRRLLPPSRSAIALRVFCVMRWEQDVPSFPTPLFSLAALFLRCALDRFCLTKPNTSCKIEMPASLRSEGVRVHPGMPFGFPPEPAFGFAGIPTPPRESRLTLKSALQREDRTAKPLTAIDAPPVAVVPYSVVSSELGARVETGSLPSSP